MQLVERIASRLGFERRVASSPSWDALQPLGLGAAVNERTAENLSTVAACVGAQASALASAAVLVYQRTAGGRVEVPEHPIAQLLRNGPNPYQTWPDLLEAWFSCTLLTGNGLLEIERDGAAITALRFVPWRWVSPMLAPSGRLIYDVTEQTGLYGQTGDVRRLLAGDVVHLKDRSDVGFLGVSRLSRSAAPVAHALALNERAQNVVAQGAAPSGAIYSDAPVAGEALERLRQSMAERHSGPRNAGNVMFLPGGLKFQTLGVTPEDAELLESRKFSVEEMCRLYQVPPPIVQDYSHNTFTNSDTAGRWFAQFTLGPWARKIEAVLSRALFPEGSGLEIELDLSVFLRGDPQTRWAAHKIAVDANILDTDEVREIEGFNARGKAVVG
ncbi:phage portal protein [Sandaracinobacteroides hominis]|uniref:phage portal protein n=1 Tax=Sandaracinobacteroides hominis TaxID=2780086 RepID=UPI0018F7499A|nr:phage portal protein [Sandaracinobacteroides hominis]